MGATIAMYSLDVDQHQNCVYKENVIMLGLETESHSIVDVYFVVQGYLDSISAYMWLVGA